MAIQFSFLTYPPPPTLPIRCPILSSQAFSNSVYHDPLSVDDNNRPISRHLFKKHLKSVLIKSDISANNYSSHSFRIGATTSVAQNGLPEIQIKSLGWWPSNAFHSYIRLYLLQIRQAHQSLIQYSSHHAPVFY